MTDGEVWEELARIIQGRSVDIDAVEVAAVGTYLCEKVDGCTCYGPESGYPHEPHCGWEPSLPLDKVRAAVLSDDDETVERIAKALRYEDIEVLPGCDWFDTEHLRYEELARAAIRALRGEP